MKIGIFGAAALAVALSVTLAAAPARADQCAELEKAFKSAMDVNEQEKAKTRAMQCVNLGGNLGMLRMLRVVKEECLDKADNKAGSNRFRELAELERTFRRARSAVNKSCG